MSNNAKQARRLERVGRVLAIKGRIMSEHQGLMPLIVDGLMTLVVGRITKDQEAPNREMTLTREKGLVLEYLLRGGYCRQKLTVHTRSPAEARRLMTTYQQKLTGEETLRFDELA
ncbi:MAG: hypothetical protein AAB900_00075 [Patescibacteria group bacterium]